MKGATTVYEPDDDTNSDLLALVLEAENVFLLGNYEKAELLAKQVLQNDVLKTNVTGAVGLGERAAIIFIQSAYEMEKFSSTKHVLCSVFASLDSMPPNALLLWLSLAMTVDTSDKRLGESLVLSLLKSKSSKRRGWTKEQFLTLLHIYTTDVLLSTLRDPSEVNLWLQRQHFLPLDPRERQFLEDEVNEKYRELYGSIEERGIVASTASQPGVHRSRTTIHPLVSPQSTSRPYAPGFFSGERKGINAVRKDGRLYEDRGGDDEALMDGRDGSFESARRSQQFDWAVAPSPVHVSHGVDRWQRRDSNELGPMPSISSDVNGSLEHQQAMTDDMDWLGTLQYKVFKFLGYTTAKNSLAGSSEEPNASDIFVSLGVLGVALATGLLYGHRLRSLRH